MIPDLAERLFGAALIFASGILFGGCAAIYLFRLMLRRLRMKVGENETQTWHTSNGDITIQVDPRWTEFKYRIERKLVFDPPAS